MDNNLKFKRVMRKIWYGTAIVLSVLVILLGTVGVVGTWIVEQALTDATQGLLGAVASTAGGLRRVTAQIDQGVSEVRTISTNVSETSLKISQNVEDNGLVLMLLPAEQEQELTTRVEQIRDTLNTIHETLSAGISMYRSINRLPFVSLPELSQESVDQIEQTMADTQAAVQDLSQRVQSFRSGVSGVISEVTQAADRVTQRMDGLHENLTELDHDLSALQDFTLRVQKAVPKVFALGAVLLTMLFAFVIYTQVEVIRLLVGRWKAIDLLQNEKANQAIPAND